MEFDKLGKIGRKHANVVVGDNNNDNSTIYICRACVAAMTSMPRRCYQFWRWSLFADYHQYDDQCDNYVRIQWKLWQLSQLWQKSPFSLASSKRLPTPSLPQRSPPCNGLLQHNNEIFNIHPRKNCKTLILKYVVVFIPCSISYLNLLRVQGVFFLTGTP